MEEQFDYEREIENLIKKMRWSCWKVAIQMVVNLIFAVFGLTMAYQTYSWNNLWFIPALGGVFLLAVSAWQGFMLRYQRMMLKSWENLER